MALKEGKFKADIPVGGGITLNNLHKLNVGLKFTETELLILSEKGEVIGILDRKYFSTDTNDKKDDAQEVESVKAPKAKTTAKKATGSKSKNPTTKKAGAK